MKNQLLLSFLLFVTAPITFIQSQSSNNWMRMGNHIFFNNTSGNVGIGTSMPSQRLHVMGNTEITGGLRVNNFIMGGELPGLPFSNAYESIYLTSPILNLRLQSPNSIIFHTGVSNTNQEASMTLAGNGRLGIGINNPSYELDVAGALNLRPIAEGKALFVNGSEALWYDGEIFSWGFGGAKNYFANPVGIGVLNPSYKLDVLGTMNSSALRLADDNSAGVIYFPSTGTYPNFYIRSEKNTPPGFDERLFISGTTGDVGIGTDNPAFKLDVAGALNLNYGQALFVGGKEALWSDGSTYSWGHGGQKNYFKNAVGIGINDPAYQLDVLGTMNASSLRLADDNNAGVIYFPSTGNLPNFYIRSARDLPGESNTRLFISGTTGNVGVGTTTPTAKLAVLINDNSFDGDVPEMSTGMNVEVTTAVEQFITNYGIYTKAEGVFGNTYGIYASAQNEFDDFIPGIASYALYAAGNVTYTGRHSHGSDKKFKENIKDFSALKSILQLRPKTYELKKDQYKAMNFPAGKRYGFIAQELQETFPELVHEEVNVYQTSSDTEKTETERIEYLGVEYIPLIPILTKGMQEQQEIIEEIAEKNQTLKQENQELKDRLTKLEGLVNQLIGKGDDYTTKTEKLTSARLGQNQPNPFTNSTAIEYFIPESVKSAELRISDLNGKVLKRIPLDARGEGKTILDTLTLNAGNYFYSLFLDGQLFETRKMVLTR